MKLLNFSEFVNESQVNEAQIKDKAINNLRSTSRSKLLKTYLG